MDIITLAAAKVHANNVAKELGKTKVSMPEQGDIVDHGTAGQFAVSDGKGGIVWKTLVEAEEVAY